VARFVVVEIPDNEEADAFMKAVQAGEVLFGVPAGTTEVDGRQVEEIKWRGINESGEWKVPQVYAVPTKFCECPDYEGVSARSQKYGWWVHRKCSKPRGTALQHPYTLLELGVDPRHLRYYMGFRADRQPWQKPREKK
jgi:hypothetical protein